MSTPRPKQLRWIKQARVTSATTTLAGPRDPTFPAARERLIAALADRPQTVAQLAQAFGLAQPTVLEQVRRALRDGLIVEVPVAASERRFAAERYYAPTVPVIRQPDRELLESACRALAVEVAAALTRHRGDLQAAFAMTTLAREGWGFDDLWPFLHDTILRLASRQEPDLPFQRQFPAHGLTWVEETDELERADDRSTQAESEEASA